MKALLTYRLLFIFPSFLFLFGTGPLDFDSSCFAQSPWTQKADMQVVRQGHSSGVLDTIIYAIGGIQYNTPSTHYNALKSMEFYDPDLDIWTPKADMDTGRAQFPTCVFDGKIYAFGGGQSVYWDPLKSIEVYDPASDTWTTLEAELPIARMQHTATLVDGKIYIIGGTDSNDEIALSEVNVYDPLTNTWDSDKADLPTPRQNLKAVELNGKIYTLGGHLGPQDDYLPLTTVESYDPANDTWTTKADMSRPRFFHAACVLNEKIYVFGGAKNCDNAWSSVEVYDPETDTWTEGASMSEPWVMSAAAPFNEKVYVSGGTFEICPPSVRSVMYEYDPNPIVNIPDATFLNALIDEGVDTNADGAISYFEAEAITNIDVSRKGISDMTGIEAFANLESLNCGGNKLTTLDVSKNILLKEVVIGYSIAWNSGWGNKLTNLDVSNNPELIKLDCSWNELTDLDVSNNPKLEILNCEFNNYCDSLDLSSNPVLTYLNCSANPLKYLNVTNSSKLVELLAGHTTYIGHSTHLDSLDISNNTELENLSVHSSRLNNLDLSNNTALIELNLFNLNLNGLDLSLHTALSQLSLKNIPIASLNLCSNTILDSLTLNYMQSLDSVFMVEGVNYITEDTPNVVFVYCTNSVVENFSEAELSICPNPTNNFLTIETNIYDYYKIEITSLNGQLMYSTEMEGTTLQVDLSSFQKGAYFITIRSEDSTTSQKIIKL